MKVTHQKPMKDIEIGVTGNSGNAKPKGKPYLRTCGKCGFNAYNKGEYVAHMSEKHDKTVPKAGLTGSRKVDIGFKKAQLDVPEEILVKPKKAKKQKDEVAKSRRGRRSAEEKAEPAKEEAKPKRKRRTKAQIAADKKGE